MIRIIGGLLCAVLLVGPAAAYCSEPSAPGRSSKPDKPEPPDRPFCVNEFTRKHTCDEWTIIRYNAEIDEYNSDLEDYEREAQSYIRRLKNYLSEAEEYAVCEAKSLDD